jgi:hypothetical protein
MCRPAGTVVIVSCPPLRRRVLRHCACACACEAWLLQLPTCLPASVHLHRKRDGRIEYHELTAAIFSPRVNAAFMAVAVVGQLGTLASMTVFVADQIVPLAPDGWESWQVCPASQPASPPGRPPASPRGKRGGAARA